eukprot:scaffold14525_cov151-Isochrysis_galbana.AAC.1
MSDADNRQRLGAILARLRAVAASPSAQSPRQGQARAQTIIEDLVEPPACRRVPCREAGLRCGRGQVLVVWRRACRGERLAPGLECCRSVGRS